MVRTPVLSLYSPNCTLKFLNQFRRNALKNQFKKRNNPLKPCTNSILLKFFKATLRKYTKEWFSPVRLIYSHFYSHRERSIFIALKIIHQISVWLSVRIKRERFSFNPMRLSYFKGKPTTPLRHVGKTIKKHMFQWKNLFIRIFLLKWKLLKHLWKRKKMGKTYTKCWTFGWWIAEVSLALWKRE